MCRSVSLLLPFLLNGKEGCGGLLWRGGGGRVTAKAEGDAMERQSQRSCSAPQIKTNPGLQASTALPAAHPQGGRRSFVEGVSF